MSDVRRFDDWVAWLKGNVNRERDADGERVFLRRAIEGLVECLVSLDREQIRARAQDMWAWHPPPPRPDCPAADVLLALESKLERRMKQLERAEAARKREKERMRKQVRILR